MAENKLTDEEIVKSLEHCATENTCRGCVKYNGEKTIDYFKCMRDTRKNVVDLINRQKAEIERLTEYNANLNGMCLEFIDKNAELQKQVDEWNSAFIPTRARQQAVKDTAREIYDFAKGFFTWDEEGFVRELKELVQDYGVEVE